MNVCACVLDVIPISLNCNEYTIRVCCRKNCMVKNKSPAEQVAINIYVHCTHNGSKHSNH